MIERIEIRNFKSIQKLDLRLNPVNILIGANGAGKSNFIDFFQLVNKIYEGKLKLYSEQKGANNLLYRGIKHSSYIMGLLDFDNTNAYKFIVKPGNDDVLYISEEGDFFNKDEDDSKNYNSNWHWHLAEPPYRYDSENRAWYVKNYLKSFRVYHFHDTSDTSPMKVSSQIDDNDFLRENGGNLASFLYYLQQKHQAIFKRIEMAVRSIAPFFERFDLKPRRINPDQIKLEWKERDSDMYLDAHNFSDGTLRFIALATLLMQPDPPKTILIDEPELGLHPVAVHKLGSLIQKASATCQVIVSTQSIELVNNFLPEDIITVDRSNGQSVFRRLEKDSLEHWLETFSLGDIWQKNIIGGQP
ncbi:MAG: AAA family ATPase [Bacteroidia bacterium]